MEEERKGLPGLRLVREERGMTQAALARALEVPERQIARWERGETSPSVWDALKLSAALDASVERLAGVPERAAVAAEAATP